NPFFLEELLSASGGADPDELISQPLPWSLGEVVRNQLEELDPPERRILEAAAVLGRRVTFDVLAAVTGTPEDELIHVLRTLVAAARTGARRYLESGSTYQALQLAELGLTEACDDTALLAFASQAAWLTGWVDEAVIHSTRLLDVARRIGDLEEESLALRRLV